ncbi:MAG: sialidase family protein [Blastocatellia bacterium]
MHRRSIIIPGLIFGIMTIFAAIPALAQETAAQKYLLSVERIWDRAPHGAFTDLVDFNGRLYCTFREGSGHVPGREGNNGAIRVIVSDDGQNWRSAALITESGVDLRDPKISVMPDGRLMVLFGGSFYEGEKLLRRETRVSFSNAAGTRFTDPRPVSIDARIRTDGDWLWRVTWQRGIGYGVLYQLGGEEYKAHLVSTRDGVSYKLVSTFEIDGRPNEATVRFLANGEMVAWVRRERGNMNGWIGFSRAPYTEWTWKEQSARLGGPNLLVLPGQELIGVTRGHLPDRKANTYLARLERSGEITPLLTLPSGGDTSYAGMVRRGERLLVSYYSSHEGKTAIYLATIDLKRLGK